MTTIKISDEIYQEAKRYANVYSRSVPKQLEYWARVGKIAEENPDLTYNFITEILLSLEDAEGGRVEEYKFGKKS